MAKWNGNDEERPLSQFEKIVMERKRRKYRIPPNPTEYIYMEECLDRSITNHFDFTMIAAHRAKELSNGENPTIDRNGDNHVVTTLREIRDGTQKQDEIEERMIQSRQKLRTAREDEIIQ